MAFPRETGTQLESAINRVFHLKKKSDDENELKGSHNRKCKINLKYCCAIERQAALPECRR